MKAKEYRLLLFAEKDLELLQIAPRDVEDAAFLLERFQTVVLTAFANLETLRRIAEPRNRLLKGGEHEALQSPSFVSAISLQADPIESIRGIPLWFIVSFPDVYLWYSRELSRGLGASRHFGILDANEEAPSDMADENLRIRPKYLEILIRSYLGHTKLDLELAPDERKNSIVRPSGGFVAPGLLRRDYQAMVVHKRSEEEKRDAYELPHTRVPLPPTHPKSNFSDLDWLVDEQLAKDPRFANKFEELGMSTFHSFDEVKKAVYNKSASLILLADESNFELIRAIAPSIGFLRMFVWFLGAFSMATAAWEILNLSLWAVAYVGIALACVASYGWLYNMAIRKVALKSEQIFCFLLQTGEIGIQEAGSLEVWRVRNPIKHAA